MESGDAERQPLKPPPPVPRPPMFTSDVRGPFLALVAGGGLVLLCLATGFSGTDSWLPWALNPTGYLGIPSFVFAYLMTIAAKEGLNLALVHISEDVLRFKRIDEAGDDKNKRLEHFSTLDYSYLTINTAVEFVGMNHFAALLMQDSVETRLKGFTLSNGIIGFILTMMLNDMLYYVWHNIAHTNYFYPFCHKHHHRQLLPFRGYRDAANQHPVEQVFGFSIFLASCRIIAQYVGLHAGAAWVAFLSWAVLNIFNYLPFDSYLHLPLPWPAYPRDHQMHLRFPQHNFNTLSTMCDRLLGTFKPFRALDDPEPQPEKPKQWWEKLKDPALPEDEPAPQTGACGRPDILPSAWSLVCVTVCIIVATCIVEWVRLDIMPDWHHYAIFAKTVIVVANASLVCYAVEAAFQQPVEIKGKKIREYTIPRMREKSGGLKEAVPQGHVKQFNGGKTVFKPNLKSAIQPKPFKRE